MTHRAEGPDVGGCLGNILFWIAIAVSTAIILLIIAVAIGLSS